MHEWEGFYVIVGTSAAALTGVVLPLIDYTMTMSTSLLLESMTPLAMLLVGGAPATPAA